MNDVGWMLQNYGLSVVNNHKPELALLLVKLLQTYDLHWDYQEFWPNYPDRSITDIAVTVKGLEDRNTGEYYFIPYPTDGKRLHTPQELIDHLKTARTGHLKTIDLIIPQF